MGMLGTAKESFFPNDNLYVQYQTQISLSGSIFGKRRLCLNGIGIYLSRWVSFQRLPPESNKQDH